MQEFPSSLSLSDGGLGRSRETNGCNLSLILCRPHTNARNSTRKSVPCQIINISSVSDYKTCPVAIAYTATKYGVRALSESLREAEGKNGVRVINISPGYVKTNIHKNMGITFEQYCQALGNPDFMTADELAEIILHCYRLPMHLCVRELVVAPTRTTF